MARRRFPAPALALVALAVACARIAPPPGGPPDFTSPRLVATVPESLAVLPGFDGWVEFTFDEVVDQGRTPNFGFGNGDLERLVLVSPDTGVPRVRWHRNRIAVRPHDGWRPNTVYRIELGAGLEDLAPRPNRRDSAAVITFTTGAPVPTRTLHGRAVDWLARRFAPRVLVEVALLPDSLVYRTVTDSSGRFRIGPLPEGEYLVSVILDQNANRRRDGREGWDSVRVGAGRDSVGEVWAFERDTLPPRIAQNGISASSSDSFAIAVNFTQPIDPALELGSDQVAIFVATDSSPMPVVNALPTVAYDSIWGRVDSIRRAVAKARADAARADSTAAADSTRVPPADTAPARPNTRPGRGTADTTKQDEPRDPHPVLGSRLVIRIGNPLAPGKRYLIELRGVRAMGGQVADTLRGTLSVPELPKPTAADSAKAKRDSTAQPPDSTAIPAARPAQGTGPGRP